MMVAALHHEVTGQGKPLVLLAGFAADLRTWVFHRDALAERHRLILIDNRGVGRSPAPLGTYSTRAMAGDVREVLRGLGIERAYVLGHSLGGAVAQELALAYPEVVERLILVSTFPYGGLVPHEVLESWRRATTNGLDEETFRRSVLPWIFGKAYLAHPNRAEAILGFLRANRLPPTEQGLSGQLAAVREHDARDRLGQIRARTLLLCGDDDRLTPPALSLEMAASIPGATCTILKAAGHNCMLEQSDPFTSAVLSFCAS